MKRHSSLGLVLAAVIFFAIAGSARAATTIGSLDTTGFNPSGGHAYLGQSFIVPAGENGLVSATLMLNNTLGSTVNGNWRIYEFTDDGSNGIFGTQIASQPLALPAGSQQAISQTFNVSVTAGNKYALIADWGSSTNVGGYFSNSSYFANGMTIFTGVSGPIMHPSDLAFQINFGVVPEPVVVPLLLLTIPFLRRRRV
jgi:hypothetical protein